MMVLVLSAVPVGLRGELTKWLYEISAGVFVGNVSARVREHLWERVGESAGAGRALIVWSSKGEQRLRFDTLNHHWEPIDMDGLVLMRRPEERAKPEHVRAMKPGWSKAGAARMAARNRRNRGDAAAQ